MFSLFAKHKNFSKNTIAPVVLVIIDGFGVAPASKGNAVIKANMTHLEKYKKLYTSGTLIASGESVGLPANEVGNTEVGHLTLGSGRVVYQDVVRISKAIEDRSFFDNRALLQAATHVRRYSSKLHLMGLVSTGNVHSNLSHLYALLDFAKQQSVEQVFLHVFTDGRDAPPQKGASVVGELEEHLENVGIGKIATVAGRYYAMDRDRRWERTQKAYEAISSGVGEKALSALEAINQSYAKNITDEFIVPTVIEKDGTPVATVDDNDACIFFNFRVDRPVQLSMAFTLSAFEQMHPVADKPDRLPGLLASKIATPKAPVIVSGTFTRKKTAKNLFFVAMTQYLKSLTDVKVAFPPEHVVLPLAEVLSKRGIKQMRLAESEKGRFVTYYFDGHNDSPFDGEDVSIVPSPRVPTYDKKPEMSVFDIVSEFEQALAKDVYGFLVMNFANPDMVAHTGSLKAAVKACKAVNKALFRVIEATLSAGGTALVTADHGNAEEMIFYANKAYYFTSGKGEMNTDHSNNPVPIVLISKQFEKGKGNITGALSDVAPTILEIMNIPKPPEMTGESLVAKPPLKASSK